MNYWIIALPRKDMEHCIKIETFGLNRKYLVGKVKAGDKVVCYVSKESKIIALGEATSDYYLDDKKVFKAEGIFPDRFNFKAIKLPSNEEFDIRELIDDLSFIKNKYYWSAYLRHGIASLPKKDWELINQRSGSLKMV